MKSPITTHILDTARGRPAQSVAVSLSRRDAQGNLHLVGRGKTNEDGRVTDLMAPGTLEAGVYSICFETAAYFESIGTASFYPEVTIAFHVSATDEHYHVPLLLNPFGYSTYRGS